jgi:ABC-type bacteriocin/lantibiotic exporter with double-glycine peptidase domain
VRRSKPRFHAQEKASSCLPACLRMVLSAYGVEVSENDLRKACGWDPLLSTSSTAVVTAAGQMGFTRSREGYGLRLYDLRDLLRRGVFPILSIQLQPYGLIGNHAQVVVSITAGHIEVYDPLLGPMRTQHRTLDEAWKLGGYLTILIER